MRLSLLYDVRIYHHNKEQKLYNQSPHKTLPFAENYKNNFLLHVLNLSSVGVNLLTEHDVYKRPEVNQM